MLRTNLNPFQGYLQARKDRDDPAQARFKSYHQTAVWYYRAFPLAFLFTIWILIRFDVGGPGPEATAEFVRVAQIAALCGLGGGLIGYMVLRRLRKITAFETGLVTASLTLAGAVFLFLMGLLFWLRT